LQAPPPGGAEVDGVRAARRGKRAGESYGQIRGARIEIFGGRKLAGTVLGIETLLSPA
jgi:hypothetical protein